MEDTKTIRDWGYWRVLDDKNTVKVKELVINPDGLSDSNTTKEMSIGIYCKAQ